MRSASGPASHRVPTASSYASRRPGADQRRCVIGRSSLRFGTIK